MENKNLETKVGLNALSSSKVRQTIIDQLRNRQTVEFMISKSSTSSSQVMVTRSVYGQGFPNDSVGLTYSKECGIRARMYGGKMSEKDFWTSFITDLQRYKKRIRTLNLRQCLQEVISELKEKEPVIEQPDFYFSCIIYGDIYDGAHYPLNTPPYLLRT